MLDSRTDVEMGEVGRGPEAWPPSPDYIAGRAAEVSLYKPSAPLALAYDCLGLSPFVNRSQDSVEI